MTAPPSSASVDPNPSHVCEDFERLEERFATGDSGERTVRAVADAVARLRDDAPSELVDLIEPWLRLITARADPTSEGANAAPTGFLFSAPPEILRWSDTHCGTALEEHAKTWPD